LQRITTHLWYDREAREAAELYTAVFPDSTITGVSTLRDTPSGTVEIVTAELFGQQFTLLSAGPLFQFNASVSFLVACRTSDEVDKLWRPLVDGGTALMELGRYPFSERYGWLEDRYGLSWQIMLTAEPERRQRIVPTLMFTGAIAGRAEEAVGLYTSVFAPSGVDHVARYGPGEAPDAEGTVRHAGFTLEGRELAAMDSARAHEAPFNEAISFMVHCETQDEIDRYWEGLSAHPEAERCGWLKDRFGLSWQVVPTAMNAMMRNGDAAAIARVTRAFLAMKKFDIAALEAAYSGAPAAGGRS